jgi:hypothetical protein
MWRLYRFVAVGKNTCLNRALQPDGYLLRIQQITRLSGKRLRYTPQGKLGKGGDTVSGEDFPSFKPEERLTKYKDRINRWWKKTKSQKHPDAMARVDDEMRADFHRLLAVCKERADGEQLADCIVRYTENAFAFAHYTGIRRGYNIGVEVGKDQCEGAIIRVITTKLDATPGEICELIDQYNSRFDDLNDKRRIHLKWPELRRQYARWTDVEHMPKVKNYLVRARKRANQIFRIDRWHRFMREHKLNRKPT